MSSRTPGHEFDRIRNLWSLVQKKLLETMMHDFRHVLHAYPSTEAAKVAFSASDLPGERRENTLVIIGNGERHMFRAITNPQDVERLAGMQFQTIVDHGHTCDMRTWSRLQALARWV